MCEHRNFRPVRAPWSPSSRYQDLAPIVHYVAVVSFFGSVPAAFSSALAVSQAVGLRLAAAEHRHKPRYSAFFR